jgi:hypothetical protein
VVNFDRSIGLEWSHPEIAKGGATALDSSSLGLGVVGCESNAELNVETWYEGMLGGEETGSRYNYWANTLLSDFGPSFYDEPLAWYATYLRSGRKDALEAARKLSRWWLMMPEMSGGYRGSFPRRMSVTGAVAGLLVDSGAVSPKGWNVLRTLSSLAGTTDPCWYEAREPAYKYSWVALDAMLDPDSGYRATALSKLGTIFTRDNGCKGADNNFPATYYTGGNYATGLTVTNGSAAVTGSGIPSDACPTNIASGTATFTNGSTTVTRLSGSAWQAGKVLIVLGARTSGPWLTAAYTWTSGDTLRLWSSWEGTTGTYSWHLRNPGAGIQHIRDGASSDPATDSFVDQHYTCTWNSPTSITLDRGWHGATSSNGILGAPLNLLGHGQQPFILGIKVIQMDWSHQAGQSGYDTLRDGASTWIWDTRFQATKGLYYGRGFQCEPPWEGDVLCSYNPSDPFSVVESRVLNSEVMVALESYYKANPTTQNKAAVDEYYGAVWGKAGGYNTGGAWFDGNPAIDVYDVVNSYKWPGFFYGMGMAHRWPAARLGGASPPAPQTMQVHFDLASVAGAAEAVITVTAPSSAKTEFRCSSAPCSIQVDRRQGTHWMQIKYLSPSGTVLSEGEPKLLHVS